MMHSIAKKCCCHDYTQYKTLKKYDELVKYNKVVLNTDR